MSFHGNVKKAFILGIFFLFIFCLGESGRYHDKSPQVTVLKKKVSPKSLYSSGLLAKQPVIFFSHTKSVSFTSQQYFCLISNQHQSPTTASEQINREATSVSPQGIGSGTSLILVLLIFVPWLAPPPAQSIKDWRSISILINCDDEAGTDKCKSIRKKIYPRHVNKRTILVMMMLPDKKILEDLL